MQIYYDDILRLKVNNFDELIIKFKNDDLFNEFKEDEIYDIRYPLLDNVRGEVVNSCIEYQQCSIDRMNSTTKTIKFSYKKSVYLNKQDKRKRIINSLI